MRILLLQLKRIGDLVVTTPAIRCLREAFPGARLTLVADAAARELVPALDVDEAWIFEKGGGNAWIRRGLLGCRADWCLDFSGTDRAALLALLSLARRRVTFGRFRGRFPRRLAFTDFAESSVRDRHTADHYTDLLAPLGIRRQDVPLDLRLPPRVDDATGGLLASAGVAGRFAVIHAGAARPEKFWLADRWAAVARDLRVRHDLAVVLTGSQAASEQVHLAEIRRGAPEAIDLSGRTDLCGLAAILRRAAVFCGVDTAAMHLADAMRTPTVALFGPTNPFHWRPRHAPAVVLRSRTGEPFSAGQPGGPMEEIAVETVMAGVDRLLG